MRKRIFSRFQKQSSGQNLNLPYQFFQNNCIDCQLDFQKSMHTPYMRLGWILVGWDVFHQNLCEAQYPFILYMPQQKQTLRELLKDHVH